MGWRTSNGSMQVRAGGASASASSLPHRVAVDGPQTPVRHCDPAVQTLPRGSSGLQYPSGSNRRRPMLPCPAARNKYNASQRMPQRNCQGVFRPRLECEHSHHAPSLHLFLRATNLLAFVSGQEHLSPTSPYSTAKHSCRIGSQIYTFSDLERKAEI
jgi:hypothetical protein